MKCNYPISSLSGFFAALLIATGVHAQAPAPQAAPPVSPVAQAEANTAPPPANNQPEPAPEPAPVAGTPAPITAETAPPAGPSGEQGAVGTPVTTQTTGTTTITPVPAAALDHGAAPAPREPLLWRMKHMFPILWSTAVPLGNSYDYTSTFSVAGLSLEYRYRILSQLSVGALFSWNNFFDKEKGTDSQDNVTITGTQHRWMSNVILGGSVHGYLTKKTPVVPYLGMNLGGYYKSRITETGMWTASDGYWHFGLAPELGLLLPAGPIGLMLNLKYNYLFERSESPSEMFLGINFGVVLSIQ